MEGDLCRGREERMRFMVAVEKAEESFAAICRRFGVSRRIGYKWLARFEEHGAAGLLDHSRAPLHHPQTIAPKLAERCLEVRRAHLNRPGFAGGHLV
jgi:transposase